MDMCQTKKEILEKLESKLRVKVNEQKMINNTFLEVLQRGGDNKDVKESLENTTNEVVELVDKIKKCKEEKITDEGGEFEDNIMRSNRFIVKFGIGINIEPQYVVDVEFSKNLDNIVHFTIVDHLSFKDGEKRPIFQEIAERIDYKGYNGKYFTFSISYINAKGEIIYSEQYYKCRILWAKKGNLSYNSDDLRTIRFTAAYDNMKYVCS